MRTFHCTVPFVALLCLSLFLVSASTAMADGPLVVRNAAVAADHPIASRVGVEILESGGNAADAAVAVGLVLGVVNPHASGIGGGGFLVWRGADGDATTLDFRERAPAAAHPSIFVVDGEVPRERFLWSGLSVAIPGEIAGWWALHQAHGVLEWRRVVEPAIELARNGFPAGQLLPERLRRFDRFREAEDIVSLLWRDDDWVSPGDEIRLPRLAETLQRVADDGPSGFYEGPVAEDIVDTVRAHSGIMTLEDLRDYQVYWREPVLSPYRGYEIIGMGSPSSSGVVIGQALRFLERFQLTRLGYEDSITAHLILQAMTHAFADRALHHGDEDFTDLPVEAMLSDERVDAMLDLWNPATIHSPEDYGSATLAQDHGGTSHFSIVDEDGNAIAVTVTVNLSFGSLLVGRESGVFLNNEMADFSPRPGDTNVFSLPGGEANVVEAGKAPLSSMSPMIVTLDDELVGTLGGSGGPRIISGTLLTLLQIVDFGRDAFEAVTAPRLHHQWYPYVARIEESAPDTWSSDLEEYGYEVDVQRFGNAVQAIWWHPEGWQAMSDPRKLGAPAGY